MAILTDKAKTVEITMTTWTGTGYTPDWSDDFFGNGGAHMDEEGVFHVDDVGYCIEQAQDWQDKRGDFCDDVDPDYVVCRRVDVDEVENEH